MSSSVSQISPFKLGIIDDTLEATDEAQCRLLNTNEKFITRNVTACSDDTFHNLMFLELQYMVVQSRLKHLL